MIWLEDDNQKLVITSYPLVLVTVVIIVALMGAVAAVISGQDVALKDAGIFYGVIAAFLLIHRRKVSVFDPQHKTICRCQQVRACTWARQRRCKRRCACDCLR
jgi:hypothetical protein